MYMWLSFVYPEWGTPTLTYVKVNVLIHTSYADFCEALYWPVAEAIAYVSYLQVCVAVHSSQQLGNASAAHLCR